MPVGACIQFPVVKYFVAEWLRALEVEMHVSWQCVTPLHWAAKPHPIFPSASPSTVNNTIIVLGVLTFALQLCLALFFMLRFLRLDNRVREALKHPDAVKKLIGEHFAFQFRSTFCSNISVIEHKMASRLRMNCEFWFYSCLDLKSTLQSPC